MFHVLVVLFVSFEESLHLLHMLASHLLVLGTGPPPPSGLDRDKTYSFFKRITKDLSCFW